MECLVLELAPDEEDGQKQVANDWEDHEDPSKCPAAAAKAGDKEDIRQKTAGHDRERKGET